LRPEHLQHFYNAEVQQGASARTVRYCHTLLYGALVHAEKHQLVARNVSKLTERPRVVRKEMHTLTLDQLTEKLLPTIAQDGLFAAIFLGFGTGLRRGEVLALRWKDVNVKTGTLQVKQTLVRVTNHGATKAEGRTRLLFQEPKTSPSRRTLPIPEECLTALKQHKARQAEEKLLGQAYHDHGLVFCQADGKPIDPRNFLRSFDRLIALAGLPPIRFHDARHTFATLMLELGESPKTVQTMLGHSRVAITLDIYSHVSLELEKKAAAKLNAALTGRG
jgi:integrase